MYPSLTVTALGLEAAAGRLDRLTRRLGDLRPLFEGPMTDAVHGFFRDQFKTEGRAGGEAWAPLALSTLERKRRRGTAGGTILIEYGEMYASLTERGHPASRRKVTRRALEVWTSLKRAGWHQAGTVKMPARPLAPETVPERYAAQWDDLVMDYAARDEETGDEA